ncbi:MAG TPA: inositol-3-phosphate synthase, partial [Thermodesulfovibrionales bacterium]|nr:inositol-3-phosphate synthase [Thermodesulfovibrionales bacterium]
MGKIRVAVAGVGNCASSLIQGVSHYRTLGNENTEKSLGLMHYSLGGYRPDDIEFVAAFDIDKRKVGKHISEAIFSDPNCTKTISGNIEKSPVVVSMGKVLDGVSAHMEDYPENRRFAVARTRPCDVLKVLRESRSDILLNYLPVGSDKATAFYADACLNTGVSLINCVPVFIASDKGWARKFQKKRIPVIGDDVKSQIGATIIHRMLT